MQSSRKLRTPLLCAAITQLALLAACGSITPGMHVGSSYLAGPVDDSARPALKTITPELVESERQARENQPKPDLGSLMGNPVPYRIGKGDILSIVPWGNPELTAAIAAMHSNTSAPDSNGASPQINGFVVDQEGRIQFPYVGAVNVEGLTVAQARDLLLQKLSAFYKRMEMSMRVQAYRSQRLYVSGEVRIPGVQPINDIPMTLMEAINRAGGVLPTGDQSNIFIGRAGATYHINLPQMIEKGIDPSRIMLTDGDVVRVRSLEDSKVFVLGEVNSPRALRMMDGRMTLNQALGEVGGLNVVSANGQQLYVIRNASGKEPQIYHLDASSPFSMALADKFDLRPRDVVYVDAAPLARWNRVVSLVLPSALSVINTSASSR